MPTFLYIHIEDTFGFIIVSHFLEISFSSSFIAVFVCTVPPGGVLNINSVPPCATKKTRERGWNFATNAGEDPCLGSKFAKLE